MLSHAVTTTASRDSVRLPVVAPSNEAVAQLVEGQRSTFHTYRTTRIRDAGRWDLKWRLHQLARMRHMLSENQASLFDAARKDVGQSAAEAVAMHLLMLKELGFLRRHLKAWMRGKATQLPLWMLPASARTQFAPKGVVLVLGSWVSAQQHCLLPLAGALCAGNAVVLKPSENAPAQGELIAYLLARYLDPEAVAVVMGDAQTGRTLVDFGAWDHVFYTGSASGGASIAASLAPRFIPHTLQVGGKVPVVVDETADVGLAARRIAQAKWFWQCGQSSTAPDFVLVVGPDILKRRLARAVADAVQRQYGDSAERSPHYGRIASDAQMKRLLKLLEGEVVLWGGQHDLKHRYLEPTLVDAYDADSPLMTEETFGPILAFHRVSNMGEAVRWLRARPAPPALYVFSHAKDVLLRLVDHGVRAGTVVLNDAGVQAACPALPMPSGVGGAALVATFSHVQSVVKASTWVDPSARYLPAFHQKRNWVVGLWRWLP